MLGVKEAGEVAGARSPHGRDEKNRGCGSLGSGCRGLVGRGQRRNPPPRPPALPGEGAGGVLSLRVSGHGACCADRGHRPTSGAAQP